MTREEFFSKHITQNPDGTWVFHHTRQYTKLTAKDLELLARMVRQRNRLFNDTTQLVELELISDP